MSWDTIKTTGNDILSADWNAMVADQKERAVFYTKSLTASTYTTNSTPTSWTTLQTMGTITAGSSVNACVLGVQALSTTSFEGGTSLNQRLMITPATGNTFYLNITTGSAQTTSSAVCAIFPSNTFQVEYQAVAGNTGKDLTMSSCVFTMTSID